jgi:glycosyltransferase involved in cell wall biosynthesis
LEILVLDDCSQIKRTSEIIKAYAHDGVRFIDGQAPPEHWLAKNFAYQQLADQANGDLILFCGVDTQFSPDSLRAIVEVMLKKNKSMISFIPKNIQLGQRFESIILQSLRYAWELALPRRFLCVERVVWKLTDTVSSKAVQLLA